MCRLGSGTFGVIQGGFGAGSARFRLGALYSCFLADFSANQSVCVVYVYFYKLYVIFDLETNDL